FRDCTRYAISAGCARLCTAGRLRGRAILRRRSDPSAAFLTSSAVERRPTNRQGTAVNVLDEIVSDQLRTDLPEIASGDTVKVSAKVVEGNRERIQVFEGTVMRL